MEESALTRLLDGLDPEQRQAVTSTSSALCTLAPAGSGKTRVLTRRLSRRVLDGSAEARHCLVLTFTRKAADELRQRTFRLGVDEEVTTGTFHAVAYAQLRQRWIDQGRVVPAVTAQPLRVLETALANLGMTRSFNPKTLALEISWAKSHRLLPGAYGDATRDMRHRPPISVTQMTRIYEAYESEKRKRRVVDYDDLLLLMTDSLLREKGFATAQRWRFRHFFVDEFQDLNKAQFDLLRAWLGERDDLFVVGDPNQAIYGWNGADASYLTEIDRYFPTIEKVRLRNNYRSSSHVLAAARAVLPDSEARRPPEPVDFRAPERGAPPSIRRFSSDAAEALGIARSVRLAHSRSWRWADMAILVRTNAQRTLIERALDESRIPYRSAGGAGWLYQSKVREVMEHLRQVPRHRLAERIADIDQIAEGAGDAVREYLDEFAASARRYVADDPSITIADFLSWIDVSSRYDGPTSGDTKRSAVTVATFHRSKGLEWPVVFLAGLEEGLVPYGAAQDAQLAEERRLFYVAITRAREELHCSWAAQRSTNSGVATTKPSPWLESIQRAAEREQGQTPPDVIHAAIQGSRAALHKEDADVDPVWAALDRWRKARAKLTGVAASVILDDEIVSAIVDLRPSSTDDLAEVPGLGAVRLATMGDEIVDIVNLRTNY